MEKLREELEGFAEELRLKEAALKDTRAGVADLKRKCDEGTALEGEKIQKEKDLQQIKAAEKKIADDLGAIDRRRKKIDDVRGDIKEKQHEEVDLQAEANMELRAAEKHHDTWKNTHEPELRQVEKELDTLRAIEQIRRFEEQTTDIQEKLDQIDAAEEELRNLEHTPLHNTSADEERPQDIPGEKSGIGYPQGPA